ncbi:hypothetical protein L2E82_12083 [Cichorium intybus]|uniref:Uncharacterized protein n=1 Tax=Cichorium intybus TaxID=13427 RepID=A0ACB9GGB9_CICIN|nr:hypothetical protein L2E82_12083 [Cichorium intybus]
MKVTKYQGNLQLTATPASYIYINPDIPETASMTSGFILRANQNPILKIQYQKDKDAGVEKERNKFTLIDLLSQKPGCYGGAQFTCKASLVRIDDSRGWFYKACNQCRKKLQRRGYTTFACEDHGAIAKPNNLYYLITAYMADETAEAKIVFFDATAAMLIQTDFNTMTNQLGFSDSSALPAPLSEVIGQTKIFQFHYTRFCKSSAIEFAADAVFEETISTTQTSAQPLKK